MDRETLPSLPATSCHAVQGSLTWDSSWTLMREIGIQEAAKPVLTPQRLSLRGVWDAVFKLGSSEPTVPGEGEAGGAAVRGSTSVCPVPGVMSEGVSPLLCGLLAQCSQWWRLCLGLPLGTEQWIRACVDMGGPISVNASAGSWGKMPHGPHPSRDGRAPQPPYTLELVRNTAQAQPGPLSQSLNFDRTPCGFLCASRPCSRAACPRLDPTVQTTCADVPPITSHCLHVRVSHPRPEKTTPVHSQLLCGVNGVPPKRHPCPNPRTSEQDLIWIQDFAGVTKLRCGHMGGGQALSPTSGVLAGRGETQKDIQKAAAWRQRQRVEGYLEPPRS